ncbi:protocadherin-15-like isoform X2 [Dreissena polymorpha]|nr:protocadherin-15-like isoform X2 [Dreissena polymorpha]
MKVPCCGVVSEWRFATAAPGDLALHVWKQMAGNSYKLQGENVYTGATANSTTRFSVGTSAQVSVELNDEIGWHSSAADIVAVEANAAFTQGAVTIGGKTAVGGTSSWPNTLVNGERWMIGAVLSPNSLPHFDGSLPASVTAKMSSAAGTSLYTITVADDNPDDVAALTVSIQPASAEFELDGRNVQVKSAGLPLGDHRVVLEVVDHCFQTGTATLTITVVDDRPEITSLPVAAVALREDMATSMSLHRLIYTDDGPLSDVTCRINKTEPAASPQFSLRYKDGTSDYWVYYDPVSAAPLSYDEQALYSLFIVCNDGVSDSDAKEIQVSITPNSPPVPAIDATVTVSAATTKNGSLVYTAAATDPEGDPLTFTMQCTCPFKMYPNGEIHATKDLNDHRTTPYVATVNVSDPYNTVGPQTITIKITDINSPPVLVQPTKVLPEFERVDVAEHTAEGIPNLLGTTTSVFTAAATDADGDTVTWNIQFENGKGADLFNFNPNTGAITTAADLNYEELSRQGLLTTTVTVRAFDGREYSSNRTLQISVTDVNEKPQFNQQRYALDTVEGATSPLNLDCPLFDVTDPDNYDTRRYDIRCGGTAVFHIPSTTQLACDAFIQQTAEYDLDNPGAASRVVTCTITVYDKGDLTATTTLEITVHEEDDNPPYLDQTSYSYTITNDTTAGAKFGNVDATDRDFLPEHRRLTYRTDSSEFGVDNNGVFVSLVDWTGVAAPTSRAFNVYVTDEAGHQDVSPVNIVIVDVPPTTTTTTTTTVLPSVYDNIDSFLGDSGNLAWLIPAVILGALAAGLMGYMIYRCCSTPGACSNITRGCFTGARRGPMQPRTVFRQAQTSRTVVRNPAEIKPVLRQTPPPRTVVRRVVSPPRSEAVEKSPAENKSSFFDCFKKNRPPPEAKTADGTRVWNLWNHTDFKQQDKWVG